MLVVISYIKFPLCLQAWHIKTWTARKGHSNYGFWLFSAQVSTWIIYLFIYSIKTMIYRMKLWSKTDGWRASIHIREPIIDVLSLPPGISDLLSLAMTYRSRVTSWGQQRLLLHWPENCNHSNYTVPRGREEKRWWGQELDCTLTPPPRLHHLPTFWLHFRSPLVQHIYSTPWYL